VPERQPQIIVSTNDSVGGNSGSAVVNKKGELVGLIFDGNIQSLPGHFIYHEPINRAEAVDSRAIIEAFNKVCKADVLVTEITGKPPMAAKKWGIHPTGRGSSLSRPFLPATLERGDPRLATDWTVGGGVTRLGSPGSPTSLVELRRGLAVALRAEADSPACSPDGVTRPGHAGSWAFGLAQNVVRRSLGAHSFAPGS